MWGKNFRALAVPLAGLLLLGEVKSAVAQGLTLSTSTNLESYVAGDTLISSVSVNNPGIPATVDFYFGALLPDGNTIVFFTDLAFSTGIGSLSNVPTLRPIVAGVNLSTPFMVSDPDFFSYNWSGSEPFGNYLIFLAAALPGAFADNSIDPGDIVGLSIATFSFGLCGNGVLDPAEECDDGNTVPGDGCSATCMVEVCGNGVLDPGEQCDDGNTLPGDGCDATCMVEPPAATVFRFSDLDLRDPHFFGQVGSLCLDLTGTFNNNVEQSITSDGPDSDTFLDLSLLLMFDPLDQSVPGGGSVDFARGECTEPMATTSCSLPVGKVPQTLTYTNLGGMSTCLEPVPMTLSGYMPGVTTPMAPCFSTAPVSLAISVGGIVVPLHEAQFAATYVDLPATSLSNGLMMGFLTESDADTTIIPSTGQPLSSILRGGTNNCAPGDDKDMGPDGMGGTTVGWWFYLNFPADLVPFKSNGSTCSGANECQSGFCVDGYCCNAACTASCDACNLAGSLGTCTVAPDGSPGNPSCSPYLCDGASSSCPASCAGDAGCVSGYYCSGSSCVPLDCDACPSGRCTCDGAACLDTACNTAPAFSTSGMLTGTTCDATSFDHYPGDCTPGGTVCQSLAAGGAREDMFRLVLDDGLSTSAFYNVTLDTSASGYDTALRVTTVCGSESFHVPTADVCASPPGTADDKACSMTGAEVMVLCGLPEGTYYGAIDSPAGVCGAWSMGVTISAASTDTGSTAGNVSVGGTFTGNTCTLTDTAPTGTRDEYFFPDTILWSGNINALACSPGGTTSDCTYIGTADISTCPACEASAASDCNIGFGSTHWVCTHSGAGSPDAVFYLALEVDSAVDISTAGASFDTVLYIMQTGSTGASPPGSRRICNDDCWSGSTASHIQTFLPAGLYYVYVDGAKGACGDFVLTVEILPSSFCGDAVCEPPNETCASCPVECTCPNCGNGVIDPAEECDDGNPASGDGCSYPACAIEPGYQCCGQPSMCAVPFTSSTANTCSCSIADCSAPGPCGSTCTGSNAGERIDTLTVPDTGCTIADITVDMNISHTYIGDLTIDLTAPDGTTVRLHNQSGGGADNIVGTYGTTLTPAQSLDNFNCRAGNGVWMLTVHDWAKCDTGSVNSWGVNLTCL